MKRRVPISLGMVKPEAHCLYRNGNTWITVVIKGLPDSVQRVPVFSDNVIGGSGRWYCVKVSQLYVLEPVDPVTGTTAGAASSPPAKE